MWQFNPAEQLEVDLSSPTAQQQLLKMLLQQHIITIVSQQHIAISSTIKATNNCRVISSRVHPRDMVTPQLLHHLKLLQGVPSATYKGTDSNSMGHMLQTWNAN